MKHERYQLHLNPGQSLQDIEKIIEPIKSYMWASEVEVSGFGQTVYLDVYKGKMKTNIPYTLPKQDPKGLTVPIGYNIKNELITMNMASDSRCYLLGGGYQGTGKSTLANGIIYSLLQYLPEHVRLILIDLKMGVELKQWSNYPHIWI